MTKYIYCKFDIRLRLYVIAIVFEKLLHLNQSFWWDKTPGGYFSFSYHLRWEIQFGRVSDKNLIHRGWKLFKIKVAPWARLNQTSIRFIGFIGSSIASTIATFSTSFFFFINIQTLNHYSLEKCDLLLSSWVVFDVYLPRRIHTRVQWIHHELFMSPRDLMSWCSFCLPIILYTCAIVLSLTQQISNMSIICTMCTQIHFLICVSLSCLK